MDPTAPEMRTTPGCICSSPLSLDQYLLSSPLHTQIFKKSSETGGRATHTHTHTHTPQTNKNPQHIFFTQVLIATYFKPVFKGSIP